MEIITLIKANIYRRKGSFTGIILLMVIISMSLTAILSVLDNYRSGLDTAYRQIDSGNLYVFLKNEAVTEEVLDSLKTHPLIERVSKTDAIRSAEISAGGKTEQNPWFLLKYDKKYKVFNNTLSGYEKEPVSSLKSGEIYVTQGAMTRMECRIGDSITFTISDRKYAFVVKGIVAEPMFGSSMIGWKQVFINDEDFNRLSRDAAVADKRTVEGIGRCCVVQLYKSADCKLTDGKFKRRINLDTGIVDHSLGTLTRDMSVHYTSLFLNTVLTILMVFILFLFLVVLIVMAHSISTGIEMDYVNIGVLKSQGFTKNKVRAIWIFQYLLAQAIGAVAGIILAIPLCRALGNAFWPITGILADRGISVWKSFFLIFTILVVSAILILLLTRKIGKVSPVRAISGGRSEVYFDSRLKAPIFQQFLSASLAFRQFTSYKRKYIGMTAIVSILIFFMLTITVLGNVLDSKKALESMGALYAECSMEFLGKVDNAKLVEFEKVVEKYSPIEKKYYWSSLYYSINGEEYYCQVYQNPDVICVTKGRAPLYGNEIVITELIADEMGLEIGEKAVVTHGNSKKEFLVSGIFQSINDTGMTFAMSLEGAKVFGMDSVWFAGYSLGSPDKSKLIADKLNAAYGDILRATANADGGMLEDTYTIAINGMKAVIYIFSVLFALVVVMMVCTKTFIQEKRDIGIYKALGFTAVNLRLQFAIRFFLVALAGSLLGTVLSILFSGRLLSSLLRSMGITNFTVRFTAVSLVIPVALICVCFFLFAFFASGKVKRVEVRELVTE